MPKKPADVVQTIKAKVASVKATRAKRQPPLGMDAILANAPVPAQSFQIAPDWAPPVAHETAPHCPQGAPWCCHVCGNMATGPVCTVDGAKGNA